MTWCRLDGQTDSSKRQQIVDQFNRVDADTCCIPPLAQILTSVAFLLSSKSGGCGINLIGASRLVLYDVDWNPSTDIQAMARIHRDGQKRNVHIYRFLTYLLFDF
jgi:DNA repair and recombination protein RAD54B